jgi:hypothetical protein
MENFPSIVIFQHKTWKNKPWLFHVLLLLLNIMENKPKFKPNPNGVLEPESHGPRFCEIPMFFQPKN